MLLLLEDAEILLELCKGGYDDVIEYQFFSRCIAEQTISEEKGRRLRTKEDGGMDSNIMQNPSDPDATFRSKAGKDHQGNVANLVKSVGMNGSIVTSYRFEKNNVSDDAMLKEYLENIELQEEKSLLTVDGAYASVENIELVASKNIKLIPTDLEIASLSRTPIHHYFILLSLVPEGSRWKSLIHQRCYFLEVPCQSQ